MEGNWGLVIFLWGSLIIGLIVLFVYESGKTPEQNKREVDMARQRYERECLSRKIVKVTPLGVSGRGFKRGGLGGALFGGFIGGVPGAVMGSAMRMGKSVPLVSFIVEYGSGRTELRECIQGSSEYKALMKYVCNKK